MKRTYLITVMPDGSLAVEKNKIQNGYLVMAANQLAALDLLYAYRAGQQWAVKEAADQIRTI